jgi:aryl-alcohol dehydrogenase-like predicted oxidoreductase
MARVVDCGGLFHGTVKPGLKLLRGDHRSFRPEGWIEDAEPKLERLREIAGTYQMTLLELACSWTLFQPAVECVVPTLIQESETGIKTIEDQLEEFASFDLKKTLPQGAIEEIAQIGDNRNSIPLKGASSQYAGPIQADQWPLTPSLKEVAKRWGIVPAGDLYGPLAPS